MTWQEASFFLGLGGALIGAAVYVKGQLSELTSEIRALRRDIDESKSDDRRASDRINALEQRVATLEAKVNQ